MKNAHGWPAPRKGLSYDAGDHYNAHTHQTRVIWKHPSHQQGGSSCCVFLSKDGERAFIGRVKLHVSSSLLVKVSSRDFKRCCRRCQSSENENNPNAHQKMGAFVFRSFCNASVVYLCVINRWYVGTVYSIQYQHIMLSTLRVWYSKSGKLT